MADINLSDNDSNDIVLSLPDAVEYILTDSGARGEAGPPGPIDTTYTDAQIAALFKEADFTVTVGSGGDYPTVNEAIEELSRLRPLYKKDGFTAAVQLLAGFTMSEQVLVRGVDLSWITITSVDVEVPVNSASITDELIDEDGLIPIIGGVDNATLPIIDVLFAYPDQGDGYASSPKDGIAVARSSSVLFRPGAGVKRPRNGLKVLYGSKAVCYMPGLTQGGGGSGAGLVTGVDFSYATARAVMVSYGSKANLARSILHHSKGDYGIYMIWGSHGDFYQSQVYDSLGNAITCRDGSFANMRETNVARSRRGYHALHNGRINARSNTNPASGSAIWIGDAAKDCVQYGVLASYNSHIDAAELNVSGSNIGVNASNASSISFIQGLADNCASRGVSSASASIIDAYGVSATLSANGFYAENGSTINANLASADNCGTGFYAIAQSSINADSSSADNCTVDGYRATEASDIQARNSTADAAVHYGFSAERSSRVNARGSTSIGSLRGFDAFEGSFINAEATNAQGSTLGYSVGRGSLMNAGQRAGTPVGSTSQTINSQTANGLITDSVAAWVGDPAKANDNAVVHLAGTETITGTKKISAANGAHALQVTRADGTTNVLDIDTTNSTPSVLIGQGTAGASLLNVNGKSYFGGGAGVATSFADFAASTTSSASARLRSGVDPTSPNSGEIWYDGVDLKFRNASTTQLIAPKSYVDAGDATRQPLDPTLTSLAAYNTNGLLTQTAADTFTGRTITGTANQVNVTNGDGVAGNPTLALPQDIATSSTPTFTGLNVGTVTIPATATGIQLFNTADQVTNFERGFFSFVSDQLKIGTKSAGTATDRKILIEASDKGTGVAQLLIDRSASPFLRATHSSTSATRTVFQIDGTSTASSGTYTAESIQPTINQTGTARAVAFVVNPTAASLGSGGLLLADFQVGGSSKAKIEGSGRFTSTGVVAATRTVTASTTIADDDHTIRFNSTSPISQALPTTGVATGQMYVLKNVNTGVVTVTNTIEGTANRTLATQYASLTVQWNGTDYDII